MTQVIRRSISYTQGVGRTTSFSLTLPGMYGSIPRCITVCESCGQSHDQSRNHLYDYPVEVDDDLQCQVCLQPLVDPVDTPCGHTFCYTCIVNHLRRNQACPCDREPLCEKHIKSSSRLVRSMLDKLRVVCPNTAYCDATMLRSSLERHLRLGCAGTYVQCPREEEGCRHVGARIQLEEHLWSCSYGQDKDRRSGKILPITENEFCVVEIPKGICDLGLIISQCGKTGVIIIEDVLVDGNAYRDGRLVPGDLIFEINNQDFTTKSLGQARLALASLNPLLRLTVLRKPLREEVAEMVEFVKDEHRSLGIQIHSDSHKHQAGIYVHRLVAHSPADECGCINIGDRILEVNGCDIRYSSLDQAAAILAVTKSERIVHLLIQHRQRLSSGSASSSRSNHSVTSINSGNSNRSPVNLSDHSSRASSGRSHKIYEEVFSPSGFTVGSQKCIIVKKSPDAGIGMSISGGVQTDDDDGSDLPVFVSAIKPGSSADLCGKIQRGDIIMSINGTSLVNMTHNEAVEIMQSLVTTTIVRLELIQGEEVLEEDEGISPYWREWMEKYNTLYNNISPLEYTITLSREGNQSFGFSIVGGFNSSKGNSPIYVKSVAPESITALDKRIQCRDQITFINNISTAGKTQSQVLDIIGSSSRDLTLAIIPHDTYC